MDVLSITSAYRENLCKFVRTYLDDKSYIWVRTLMSDLNKKVMLGPSDYIWAQSILMLRNFVPFFRDYCDEVTPGGILYTLYSCAIQLGVRKIGDSVEKLEQFIDDIDMEDWNQVNEQIINNFDVRAASCLVLKAYRGCSEEGCEVWGGGMYTLQTMDFLPKQIE